MDPVPGRVEIKVEGHTFGPHTRVFGITFKAHLPKKRGLSFYIGGGGNNRVDRGVFTVNLPGDFHLMNRTDQALLIQAQVEADGGDTSYYSKGKGYTNEICVANCFRFDWDGHPCHPPNRDPAL
jgi:hypothetical protein